MFAERIVHVDMDAFFVEVERRRSPGLMGKAVLVGGTGVRSVVASASYEARARGVHSGMPMTQARRLCPHAVIVRPDHDAYRAASHEVFSILDAVTPRLEAVSVDEAFLDIGGLRLLYPSPRSVGETIRRDVTAGTGLPCSVGIGTSKLVAKLASRDAKPSGLLVVPAGTERVFLDPHPVRALWGVGEATYARLEELGVASIGDLAAVPRGTLVRRLGVSLGGLLADLAHGHDERPVTPGGAARSISVEETYDADLQGEEVVRRELLALADRLAERLRTAGVLAGAVHLKVRYDDFTTVTRSHTFEVPVATAQRLFQAAVVLIAKTAVATRPVRLLGLGGDGLTAVDRPQQLDLDPRPWDDVEAAMGEVRDRFGRGAVERARLLDGGGGDPPPPR